MSRKSKRNKSVKRSARIIRNAYQQATESTPVDPETGKPRFTSMSENIAYTAKGPAREILSKCNQAFENSTLIPCSHILALLFPEHDRFMTVTPQGETIYSDNSYVPEIAFWSAWKPDILVCPMCTDKMLLINDDENYRCDGCGNLAEWLTQCTSILSSANDDFPAITCHYALCNSCAKLSGINYLNS